MASPRYATSTNQVVRPARELQAGGEGTVYELAGSAGWLAKIYHQKNRTPERESKLKAMIANPPQDDTRNLSPPHISLAWPVDVLYEGRAFAGFLMPDAGRVPTIFQVYNPTARDQSPLSFDWLRLHHIAKNLAIGLNALHARGYVMGDVNQGNILVTASALVTLIDTDSFQVRDPIQGRTYRCSVGVPEYTPPELQGVTFASIDREPYHDHFGLAVIVFQLLMEGFHPFQGAPKNPFRSLPGVAHLHCIKQGLFPYEANREFAPPPSAPDFAALHPEIQGMFVRCFVGGHRVPSARPTARQWIDALDRTERGLVQCRRNKSHWYSNHAVRCHWCEREAKKPLPVQRPLTPTPPRPAPAQPTPVAIPTPAGARWPLAISSGAGRRLWTAVAVVAGIALLILLGSFAGRERSPSSPSSSRAGSPSAVATKVEVPRNPAAGAAVAVDLGGGVGLDLVGIPAGSFSMGSVWEDHLTRMRGGDHMERPVHTVTFAKPFYLGKYEVTQVQWQAVMGDNPSYSDSRGPRNPVNQVTWDRCQEFLRKLSGLTGHAFALPTEAEWEYACRAGSTTEFCFGDAESALGQYAWYSANSGRTTHPVGQKRPNAWGLYDMHGNVWEWCQDVHHGGGYLGAPADGSAWLQGGYMGLRVLRGGSALGDPRQCRSACRFWVPQTQVADFDGLRVCLRDFNSFGGGETSPSPPTAEPAKVMVAKPAIAGPTVAVDLGGGVKLDLVRIPAGSFRMGSDTGDSDEKPVHDVRFAKPFYMGKTEVTQKQWQAVMGTKPSSFEGEQNPVGMVSWDDCQDLLKKLNERTGRKFVLPSEAEWEYACRAGSTTGYCFGENDTELNDTELSEYAWYSSNSSSRTQPVGQKKPNAWGLFDMHGNEWEWCEDVYHSDYAGAPGDGSAWLAGGSQGVRVVRGGSWLSDPGLCRSAHRGRGHHAILGGLRVVLRDF